jgi:hypothetical protein
MIEPGLSAKPKMIANIEPPDGSFFCRDRLYAELLHAFRLMVATPDLLLEFVIRMGPRSVFTTALMLSVPFSAAVRSWQKCPLPEGLRLFPVGLPMTVRAAGN